MELAAAAVEAFHGERFDEALTRLQALVHDPLVASLALLATVEHAAAAAASRLPAHQAMLDVSKTIWETCKTYLFQQGKFLLFLWALIAACIIYYFGVLEEMTKGRVGIILLASVIGILGSYVVAWFGIRINTVANSRAAFSSMSGNPLNIVNICLRSGMSVGLLLVSIELLVMIIILAYIPSDLAGACFIGFAIGESLGASALRICGGIFTKIADIGSDLMKIVFHLPEDDPKNPGVIADCTGDNAGDSVGPTADGFETYGVTGVALITFLALALKDTPEMGGRLIIWIFAMRILMIITSLVSYFINHAISEKAFSGKKEFNFEHPLTNLVWITSLVSIGVTFGASYLMLGELTDQYHGLWWSLAIIISCGTIAGALIPEFTKIFTSTSSRHCEEVVNASKQGGASLNILSGLVAGNFSAFWLGLVITSLMFVAYMVSQNAAVLAIMPEAFKFAAPVFACALVVAWAQSRPRSQMSACGETFHIHSNLGDDHLRCLAADPGDRTEQFNGLGKRDRPFHYLLGDLPDGFIKKVQMSQDLLKHKAMMSTKATFQSLLELGDLLPQTATSKTGQHIWVRTASEEGLHHGAAAGPHHIRRDAGKLDISRLQQLVEPVDLTHSLIAQRFPVPSKVSKIPYRFWGDEAPLQETMRQKVGDPLTVFDIRLAPGDCLDVRRVDQKNSHATLKHVVDRLPVDSCALHGHVRDVLSREPVVQNQQIKAHCRKCSDLFVSCSGIILNPGTSYYRLLVNIQTRYSPVQDRQHRPPPAVNRLARCPSVIGFYLACSQQQSEVPLGIRGALLVRLSAPVRPRPWTSRHRQAYHTWIPHENATLGQPFSSSEVSRGTWSLLRKHRREMLRLR